MKVIIFVLLFIFGYSCNDELDFIQVHEDDGTLFREYYSNKEGYVDKFIKEYYPTGELKIIVSYSNGVMIDYKEYYKSGKLKKTIEGYKNNLFDGEGVVFYESGEIKEKKHYEHGNLHGKWITYFKNGTTRELAIIYKGIRLGEQVYDSLGNQISENRYFQILKKDEELGRNKMHDTLKIGEEVTYYAFLPDCDFSQIHFEESKFSGAFFIKKGDKSASLIFEIENISKEDSVYILNFPVNVNEPGVYEIYVELTNVKIKDLEFPNTFQGTRNVIVKE